MQSLILLLLSLAASSVACPDGWVRVGESCYHVSEEYSNWEAARQVGQDILFFKKSYNS